MTQKRKIPNGILPNLSWIEKNISKSLSFMLQVHPNKFKHINKDFVKKIGNKNRLSIKFPKIAEQWHPTKNGDLTPHDVFYGSTKKVWWLGSCGHEWESIINNRTNKHSIGGCPCCLGRFISKDNCLSKTHPQITKQWHPVKNGDLTPHDVTYGSKIKVWWLGPCGHEWKMRILSRTSGKQDCPKCCQFGGSPIEKWINLYYSLQEKHNLTLTNQWLFNHGYGSLAYKVIRYPEKFQHI